MMAGLEAWRITELLRLLERKEFVRREQRSAVAGATQHAFVHALVRDTAYGQLPRAARAARHVAAAGWIESLPEDRAEDRAETLAHHYVTAIELYRAAGEDVSELRANAFPALQEAGERSLLLYAYPAAARFLEQALDLLPEGLEPTAELLLAAGTAFGYVGRRSDELPRAVDAFVRAGDVERAAEAAIMASRHGWHAMAGDTDAWLDRAATLVEQRPPSRAKALVVSERARRSMLTYRPETGYELSRVAIDLAREVGDVETEADALITLGCTRVSLGDAEGVHDLEVALDLVRRRGAVAGRAMTNLGWAYLVIGDLERSHHVTEEGVAQAEREGDVQTVWFSRGNLATSHYALGAWDEALRVIDAFDDAPDGVHFQRVLVRGTAALILAARDHASEALEDLRDALGLLRRDADEQAVWPALIYNVRLAQRLGRWEEAESILDELMEIIAAHESVGDAQDFHVELVIALLDARRPADAIVGRLPVGPWREGCAAAAAGEFVRAADILDSIGEQPLQAELRLRAARELVAEGRLVEAAEQLERARSFWRRVGATAYLREADSVVAAAS
jgi:tetratricopeptide (TPR) repeat protein